MSFVYLIDTNVLLRLYREHDPLHRLVVTALEVLDSQGADLCFSLQNIAEFWNVCTRPAKQNGYGLSINGTNQRVKMMERTFTLLPDSNEVYAIWRQLVLANDVRGVQVHDARLAALMQTYGVANILTLNQPNFTRYSNVRVVHPSQVLA